MALTSTQAAGLGQLGAGIGSMLAPWDNPAEAAMPYLNQIPDVLKGYYTPYIEAGSRALPTLESTYGNLLTNPGGTLNTIGAGFKKSPGFDFALKTALNSANNKYGASGMSLSPEHTQYNMGLATNLANQDFYNWLTNAMGLYGKGLAGEENLYGKGFEASTGLADNLASILALQSKLGYEGANAENQHEGGGWGSLLGGVGSLISAFL